MKHYGEAAGKYREAGVALKVAHTVRHRGDIYRDQNRPDLAEPCYNEALEIYRAHKEAPLLDVANCIRGLALLKDEAGELDHAKLLWEEAGSLYAVEHVQAGVEECSRRLAAMAHRRAQNG
jgi:tetratricopeptide (TPR) repeat protein